MHRPRCSVKLPKQVGIDLPDHPVGIDLDVGSLLATSLRGKCESQQGAIKAIASHLEGHVTAYHSPGVCSNAQSLPSSPTMKVGESTGCVQAWLALAVSASDPLHGGVEFLSLCSVLRLPGLRKGARVDDGSAAQDSLLDRQGYPGGMRECGAGRRVKNRITVLQTGN